MAKRITILFFLFSFQLFAQTDEDRSLLSDALASYGAKYQWECEKAMVDNNMDRVKYLFDSITYACLRGKYFDNFQLNKISGKQIKMTDFKKPVVLITLSTWYIYTDGEYEAVNQLAKKYHKQIDFVVLYWGQKRDARKASKKFNSYVNITYFNELKNKGAYVVGKLKHIFGFPTCYYLNSDKSIISITRGSIKKPFYADQEKVREENFDAHFVFVKEMLVDYNTSNLATK